MDIFTNCTFEKPKRKSTVKPLIINDSNKVVKQTNNYDAISLQARTLDTQYNQWLKQKQGMNYERVSFNNFKESELYDESEMEIVI